VEECKSNCGVLLSGCAGFKDVEVVSRVEVDTSTVGVGDVVGSLTAVARDDIDAAENS